MASIFIFQLAGTYARILHLGAKHNHKKTNTIFLKKKTPPPPNIPSDTNPSTRKETIKKTNIHQVDDEIN